MEPFVDLVALVEEAVVRHRERPLFGRERDGAWAWTTYGEFGEKVARLRGALVRLGVKRGDRVGVVSSNREEWAIVLGAAHGVGAVIVPMYEVQLEKDWRFILKDSGSTICFTSNASIDEKIRAMKGDLPALAHVVGFERMRDDDTSFNRLLRDPPRARDTAIGANDLATFIYTSGTTGAPKGVKLTHGAIARTVSAMREVWSVRGDDRAVSILPWAHVGGFFELLSILTGGASVALPASIDKVQAAIVATQPTSLGGVPRVWNKFYDAIYKGIAEQPRAIQWLFHTGVAAQKKRNAGKRLRKRERVARRLAKRLLFPRVLAKLGGHLKYAVSGAAALSKEVGELFECLGVTVIEVYGQTEVSAIATANKPGDARLGSVGRPLPGVRIEIDGSVSPSTDGSGEIVIFSPGAMVEYHGLPAETSAVMTDRGGIRTGDLGRFDGDGFLHITGRVREVYKLENGKFVAPVPIEEKITLSPYIAQAMVHGLNKPHNVALLVADLVALRRFCQDEGIGASDAEAILREPRVRALVAREVEAHTREFKGYERIKDFILIAEELTAETDMLTPTMKLKRRNVLGKYGAVIEGLYAKT